MSFLKGVGALALTACLALPLLQANAAPVKQPTGSPSLADIEDFSKDPAYAKYYNAKPAWSAEKCQGSSMEYATDFECERLAVPKDWKDLSKGELTIVISRKIGADGPGKRLLLSNPGGPGQEGIHFGAKILPEWIESTKTHVGVGIDPRGIGASTPIRCTAEYDRKSPGNYRADGDARTYTAEGVRIAAADRKYVLEACTEQNKDLAPYINSLQTARDFNYVRAFLGYQTADYYGVSYGAWLGGLISKMYPTSFERMIVDGAPNWFGNIEDVFNNFDETMQAVFDRSLLPYLAEHDDIYHLGTTVKQVNASYEKARKNAKKGNQAADSPDYFDYLIRGGLYGSAGYHNAGVLISKLLGVATSSASTQDAKAASVPSRADEDPAPTDPAPGWDFAYDAIRCGDTVNNQDAERWFKTQAPKAAQLPLNTASNLVPMCYGWPYKPALSKDLMQRPSGNVLLLNNEADPATGYPGASLIPPREKGDLKFVVGEDLPWHGVPGRYSTCIKDYVDAFLASGKKPATHMACQVGPTFADATNYETGEVIRYSNKVVYEFMNPGGGAKLPRVYSYFVRDLSQPKVDTSAPKPADNGKVQPQGGVVRRLSDVDREGDRILREAFARQVGRPLNSGK